MQQPYCYIAALVLLLLPGAACAPAAPRPPEATLAIDCSDGDALVFLDGHLAGRARDSLPRPFGLRAGPHRVELRSDGKLAAYRTLTLHTADAATLHVTLRDDLDAADAARLDPAPPPAR